MHKILLVDDERRMLDLLALYLTPHQYRCTKAQNAQSALHELRETAYDLVLLDIMMPDVSGWELCTEIRRFSDVPIIMLTAREQQDDIVKGLKLGADDYITKPFDEQELLARMEALLRRTSKKTIEIKGLEWDEERFELTYRQAPIKLTPKEFFMVGQLLKHPGKVFTRDLLIELIWGFDSETEGRTVDSHVRNVREKIRHSGFPIDEHLLTVWGLGYKWVSQPESI